MDQLRAITDNINVFVRFFESINCLIYQLQWLKHHMMHASTDILIFSFIILLIVAVTMISCIDDYSSLSSACSSNVLAIPIFLVIICIFIWFLYKRYRLRQPTGAAAVVSDENEKFFAPAVATVPSAEVFFCDREVGIAMEPISKRH